MYLRCGLFFVYFLIFYICDCPTQLFQKWLGYIAIACMKQSLIVNW